MSRRAAIFTAEDITRALRGAMKAKMPIARCEITGDGRIVLIPGQPAGETPAQHPLAKEEEGYL